MTEYDSFSDAEWGIVFLIVIFAVFAFSAFISLILWGVSNTVYGENSALMQKGLRQLNNRWNNPIIVSVVYGAIVIAFSVIESFFDGVSDVLVKTDEPSLLAFGVVLTLISLAIQLAGSLTQASLNWGSTAFFLNFVRGRDNGLKDLFMPFRNRVDFFRAFGCSFMIGLFTLLWTLLLIVPGVIAAYSYSMTFFILSHNPEIKVMDAIARSKELMNGHKAQLFWLQCRFIGWHFLALMTLGVGYIWLAPYVSTTTANFFESLLVGTDREVSQIASH